MTATAVRARPAHLFVSAGRTLLVTDAVGSFAGTGNEGLFVDNTRILASEELRLDGRPLLPFSAAQVERRALLSYAQAAPTEHVEAKSVYVEVHRRLGAGMTVELHVHNFGRSSLVAPLEIGVAADFADTEETHRGERRQEAPVVADWDQARRQLTLRYDHAELRRASIVAVAAAPGSVAYADGTITLQLDVPPRESARLAYRVEAELDGRRGLPADGVRGQVADVARVQEELVREAARLETTNATVAQAWRTAVEDLAALPLGLPTGPATPAAGLPLYQYLFGRDTLTVAWQALLAVPRMAADTLEANAHEQGRVVDDWRDEEPGKLLHQARGGPMSALGDNPFASYFGDYAAPQDFLILLGQHLAWTADAATTRRLLTPARNAIEWLERFGDVDGDGFLEYLTRSEKGVRNQGWKDSPDAIVDERGELVKDPIATCEIQAYWYAGLRQAAFALLRCGDRVRARRLLRQAKALRDRFDAAFWLPEEAYYATALGPDKKPVRSVTSNPGHLLATGIVPPSRARRVVDRLLADDLFSGWGVRTLSSAHPSYNPFAYHLGSVWPVDSATFALGFARYGHVDALHRIAEGFFAAADVFAAARLPEALGGFARDEQHPHPGIYPEANEPQAWSASAVVLMVQALLGLRPMAPANLLLVDPHLPPWLPDLRLEGVRVGRAVVDLDVARRDDGSTGLRWQVSEGRLRVLRQAPPQAPQRTPLRRAVAAIEGTFE